MGAGRWGEGEKGTGRRRRRSKTRRKAGAQKHGENPALKNTAKYADGGSKSVKQREQVCVCVCARARVRVCVCVRARARVRVRVKRRGGPNPSHSPAGVRVVVRVGSEEGVGLAGAGLPRGQIVVKKGQIWSKLVQSGPIFVKLVKIFQPF